MFIAVDLRVIEGRAGGVARAAEVSEDRILAGLVRLWHRVWAEETDILGYSAMGAVFGSAGLPVILAALVSGGFLESRKGGTYRVRGAKRYIRLKESRRRGGLASASNLRRGQKPGSRAGAQPGLNPGSRAGVESRLASGTSPALSVVGDADRPNPNNFSTSALEEESF